jgi:hypothetical protein
MMDYSAIERSFIEEYKMRMDRAFKVVGVSLQLLSFRLLPVDGRAGGIVHGSKEKASDLIPTNAVPQSFHFFSLHRYPETFCSPRQADYG